MNEIIRLLLWQMAQILGYEGQNDLAEHSILILVDFDTDECHPVYIGKNFLHSVLTPSLSWSEAVRIIVDDVVEEEYRKETELFLSEQSARRKYEKQRLFDSVSYVSKLGDGKRWTHCIQSLFTSQESVSTIVNYVTKDSLNAFDPYIQPGIFIPESSDNKAESPSGEPHLLSYFMVIEIDAIRKSMESLRYLARHDQLTGLLNRHMLEEMTNDEPCYVIMMDINRFKNINDSIGHAAGDEALCRLALRLEEIFDRKNDDLIFRPGGDEFVVVMKNISEEEVCRRLVQLCEPIAFAWNGETGRFSVSVGYAHCDGSFRDAMHAADEALYVVKNNGRHGYRKGTVQKP